MKDITPDVAEAIVSSINTFLVQLGRYAATPLTERDEGDAGLVNEVRVAAGALMGAIEAVARLPMTPPLPPSGIVPTAAMPTVMPAGSVAQPMATSPRPSTRQ